MQSHSSNYRHTFLFQVVTPTLEAITCLIERLVTPGPFEKCSIFQELSEEEEVKGESASEEAHNALCWLHLDIGTANIPVGRQYFKAKNAGGLLLQQSKVKVVKEVNTANIKNQLIQICGNINIKGINKAAIEQLKATRAQLSMEEQAQKSMDSNDPKLKQLQNQYIAELGKQLVQPTAFMNSFHSEGKLDEYRLISLKLSEFQQLYKNYTHFTIKNKEHQAEAETLQLFCEQHPLGNGESLRDVVEIIQATPYVDALFQVFRTVLANSTDKVNTVWIIGPPNAGKTRLISLIREIFLCQDFVFTESKYSICSEEQKFQTQIVLLDEANFHDLFKKSNVANMKTFFEGKGTITRTMYQQPTKDFIGAKVIVTSNGLPWMATDGESTADWAAIKARVQFVELEQKFDDKGSKAFPFDATQLAHFLMFLLAKYCDGAIPQRLLGRLNQPKLIGKRVQRTAKIESEANLRLTRRDINWKRQKQFEVEVKGKGEVNEEKGMGEVNR